MDCGYGHGECKAPDTQCPHWKGTFCELDMMIRVIDKFDKEVKEHPEIIEKVASKYCEQFVNMEAVALGDKVIMRDCHKCVYKGAYSGCNENPLNCKKYKCDAPDGGYYGYFLVE